MAKKGYIRELRGLIKENKATFAVYIILRVFVITSSIISAAYL